MAVGIKVMGLNPEEFFRLQGRSFTSASPAVAK
jgi:hypothetical protein